MSEERWRCIGRSVRGASHVRSNLPNQDAIEYFPESGHGLPLILAIADGHGSAKSFRSHIGSRFAVAIATRVLREFVRDHRSKSPNQIGNLAKELLPMLLVDEWTREVEDHRQKHRPTEEEKQKLQKEGVIDAVRQQPLVAYGATLLAVAVTETYTLYLQLGDGDILEVDDRGETNRPLPPDERLIANETTSLCTPTAREDFRVKLYPRDRGETPALILVSTDGYANSFHSDEEFFQIGKDYLDMIRSEGLTALQDQLEDFLTETSRNGSGDDITLGILTRVGRSGGSLPRGHLAGISSGRRSGGRENGGDRSSAALASIEPNELVATRYEVIEDDSGGTMARYTEDRSSLDLQFQKLTRQQNKNAWILLIGLPLVFALTLASLAFSAWSWWRMRGFERRIGELEGKLEQALERALEQALLDMVNRDSLSTPRGAAGKPEKSSTNSDTSETTRSKTDRTGSGDTNTGN